MSQINGWVFQSHVVKNNLGFASDFKFKTSPP